VNDKQYYVYIMTSDANTVLYTGFTGDLLKRVWEHKEKVVESFTRRYNVKKLVYFETTENVDSAILREKQIKAGSRKKKMELVDSVNPHWKDLWAELTGETPSPGKTWKSSEIAAPR